MSHKKEAVFGFIGSPKNVWLDNEPNPHRKGHINYSQSIYTVIAYLMQRFELTQNDARELLTVFLQPLAADIKVPSQGSTSRELKKYKRVLYGWKYITIDTGLIDEYSSVSVSYKKPDKQYQMLATISGDQSENFTLFKLNGQNIKLKRVRTVKTPPPHSRVILEQINQTKADNHSVTISKWLAQHSKLVNQTADLLKLKGDELFNALIPLMPRLKDKEKKLLISEQYSQLEKQPNKQESIKKALLGVGSTNAVSSGEQHIRAQAILFKYKSSEIKIDVYRQAIWVHCPYSKLNFIRLNSAEFVDKNEFDQLEINKEEIDRYTPIEMKGKIFTLKLIKTNNKLNFHLALIDEVTFWDWNSYLRLSKPEKNTAANKPINDPNSWGYKTQDICVGEKILKDKEITLTRKQPLNSFILNFVLGDKKDFSKNSFTKHLKTWISYLNETSQGSPEDNRTYNTNKHILIVSD